MIINDCKTIKFGNKFIMKKAEDNITLYEDDKDNFAVLVLNILELILVVNAIRKYGGIISSMRKVDLLAESDKATSYLKYIALYSFIYAFVCKGKYSFILRIFGVSFIIYTFLLGHRSYAVMGLIGIFMYYIGSTDNKSMLTIIREHTWWFLLMVIAALFFLFIKNTYAALFAGNFELVKERLSNPDYYRNAILVSEANTVMRNLQNIIESDLPYKLSNYLLSFVTLIPFVGGRLASFLGYQKFSVDVNLAFNERYDDGFGIGCTYIGEAYALGWYFGVLVIVFLTMLFLMYLNWKIQQTHDTENFTFLTITACYFTFFIHRNSQSFLFIMIRAQIYILILLKIISKTRIRNRFVDSY